MIIALESGDSAGKSTQAVMLAQRLGVPCFAFPDRKTPTGKLISKLLGEPTPAAEEDRRAKALLLQSLMLANMAEVGKSLRECAEDPGPRLVLDRYMGSTFAYGHADGLESAWLDRIHSLTPPAFMVYLDVTVDESFRRRPERREAYEADVKRQWKVRAQYLRLCQVRGWTKVDGMGTVEEVAERLLRAVVPYDIVAGKVDGLCLAWVVEPKDDPDGEGVACRRINPLQIAGPCLPCSSCGAELPVSSWWPALKSIQLTRP